MTNEDYKQNRPKLTLDADMIPFDELTEDVVVTWVQHKLTGEQVATIETALQAQLDEQQSPTRASGLPWQQALT